MARIRKFSAYRNIERPYTRKSKYRKKNFIRAAPVSKVVRYNMGNINKKFEYTLSLTAKSSLQIRHNAIESARQTTNKVLETQAGKGNYFFRIRIYPHHILRENPLASGAGADRMSTGMKKSFGKAISIAAQVKKGQVIAEAKVNKQNLEIAKKALKRASYKFPCSYLINVSRNG